MVKLSFAHLCEYTFLLANRTPGVVGIFSKLKADALPAYRDNIGVIAQFDIDDDDAHQIQMIIRSPSGKVLRDTNLRELDSINKQTDQVVGYIINLGPLKLEEEGDYTVDILVDQKSMGTRSFNLIVKK